MVLLLYRVLPHGLCVATEPTVGNSDKGDISTHVNVATMIVSSECVIS